MKNIFLVTVIALVGSSAMAHNPLTAKFELNTNSEAGAAILNIYTSQTGVHQAMIKYYTATDFASIEATEYKKLLVQYLKKHISIHADNTLLEVGEGGIKLGNHQTDLKFLIENYPSEVKELKVEINAFQENENHHSAFWWKTKNGKSKLILSDKNNFQGFLDKTSQNHASSWSTNIQTIVLNSVLVICFFTLLMIVFRQIKIRLKTVAN